MLKKNDFDIKVHETCIYSNKQQHSMLFAFALRTGCWYHLTKSLTQYSNLPWRCHSFVLKDGPREAEDYINTQLVVWLHPFSENKNTHSKESVLPKFFGVDVWNLPRMMGLQWMSLKKNKCLKDAVLFNFSLAKKMLDLCYEPFFW